MNLLKVNFGLTFLPSYAIIFSITTVTAPTECMWCIMGLMSHPPEACPYFPYRKDKIT